MTVGTDSAPVLVAGVVALVLLAGCAGGEVPMPGEGGTPHETYAARLRATGLETTALGRDWLVAARSALRGATRVDLPHREVRYLDPRVPSAMALRVVLESGQRLIAHIDVSGANPVGLIVFLDLFAAGEEVEAAERVASADSARWTLAHVARRGGDYVLRVQPELLRGGRVTVTLRTTASLGFPIDGGDLSAVRSRFGASRDAGRRDHDGIDLLAPHGTPVVAAARGRVTAVRHEPLGGNIVWLRERERDRRLYHAHLDRAIVRPGAAVRRGDTLGFVGTSGNARGERPHLHFAVHWPGVGLTDPYFHLVEPVDTPPAFTAERRLIGARARTGPSGAVLRARPHGGAVIVAGVGGRVPLDVEGGAGSWYFVRLPDGRRGYLPWGVVRPLAPLHRATVRRPHPLRVDLARPAVERARIEPGERVVVLGRYRGFLFVEAGRAGSGWVDTAAVTGRR